MKYFYVFMVWLIYLHAHIICSSIDLHEKYTKTGGKEFRHYTTKINTIYHTGFKRESSMKVIIITTIKEIIKQRYLTLEAFGCQHKQIANNNRIAQMLDKGYFQHKNVQAVVMKSYGFTTKNNKFLPTIEEYINASEYLTLVDMIDVLMIDGLKMFKYIHGKGYILKNFHAGCLSIDNTGERLGFWLTDLFVAWPELAHHNNIYYVKNLKDLAFFVLLAYIPKQKDTIDAIISSKLSILPNLEIILSSTFQGMMAFEKLKAYFEKVTKEFDKKEVRVGPEIYDQLIDIFQRKNGMKNYEFGKYYQLNKNKFHPTSLPEYQRISYEVTHIESGIPLKLIIGPYVNTDWDLFHTIGAFDIGMLEHNIAQAIPVNLDIGDGFLTTKFGANLQAVFRDKNTRIAQNEGINVLSLLYNMVNVFSFMHRHGIICNCFDFETVYRGLDSGGTVYNSSPYVAVSNKYQFYVSSLEHASRIGSKSNNMANVIDFIAPDVQLGKNVYEISEAIEAWFMVLAVADVLWVEKNDAGDHIKKFTEPEMLVAKEEAIKTDESTFEFVMNHFGGKKVDSFIKQNKIVFVRAFVDYMRNVRGLRPENRVDNSKVYDKIKNSILNSMKQLTLASKGYSIKGKERAIL